MLVLNRGIGEKIVIGDNLVTITIVEIRGRTVRIGFEGPKHVPIYRQEIYDQKARENAADHQADEPPAAQ